MKHSILIVAAFFILLTFSPAPGHASAILKAVTAGDIVEVQRLIDSSKAVVNEANQQGMTPLHIASLNGRRDLAELLLNAGALCDQKDSQGLTPLLMAASRGYGDIIDLLLNHGADGALRHPAFGGVADIVFATECRKGQAPSITQGLIKRGLPFNPNAASAFGLTPLRMAVALGNVAAAAWLLEQGADINLTLPKDGRTPLTDAVFRNRSEVVQLLLDKGADVAIADNDGNTALLYAIKSGNAALVKSLLDHGANVGDRDRYYRRNALHWAAIKGHPDMVRLLLERGADAMATDSLGRTPLTYARQYGHRSATALLQGKSTARAETPSIMSSEDITRPLKSGEATAWYLNNRGWVIRTGRQTLIFDSEEFRQVRPPEPSLANGFLSLPEISADEVYAFYTCFHGDSGELEYIHQLEDSLPKVAYIHNVDDPWRGAGHILYLGPGEHKRIDGVTVHTFKTTSDESMPILAYLVEADSLTVAYIGFATDDPAALARALDSMAAIAKNIDIAFLPIPEPDAIDSSDLRAFMEKLHPRAVCLLDPDRREYLFPSIAAAVEKWGTGTSVFCAQNPGDHFLYRPGR